MSTPNKHDTLTTVYDAGPTLDKYLVFAGLPNSIDRNYVRKSDPL